MSTARWLVVLAACGGAAPPAQVATSTGAQPAAVDSSALVATLAAPVALPEAPAAAIPLTVSASAYVIASGKQVRAVVPGKPDVRVGGDDDPNEAAAKLQALLPAVADRERWPAATACARPTRSRAPTHVIARREPPRDGDVVILVDATKPASGLVGLLAMASHPTAIAVQTSSTKAVHVLPLRFCAAEGDQPHALPSGIEVGLSSATVAKLVIGSSGGTPEREVAFLPWAAQIEDLASAMRAAALNQPIATVRTRVHEGVPVAQLIAVLAATLAADARSAMLELQPREHPIIGAHFGSVRTTGGADTSRVRSVLHERTRELGRCYQRAAFVNPDLAAATIEIRAHVAVGGIVHPVLPAGVDPVLASCLSELVASVRVPRTTSPGTMELEVKLHRKTPPPEAPGVTALTGAGQPAATDEDADELHEYTFPGPRLVNTVSRIFTFWGDVDSIAKNIAAPTLEARRGHAFRVIVATMDGVFDERVDVRGFKLGTGACAKLLASSRRARGEARTKIARCLGEHGPIIYEDALVAYGEGKRTGRVIVDLRRTNLALDAYLDVTARRIPGLGDEPAWRVTSLVVRPDRARVAAESAKLTPLGRPD